VSSLIVNLLPRFDRYDVLRAGLGELAFLLAALGLRVAAFEPNLKRFSALVAGLERISNDDGEVARRVTVGRAGIPDVPMHSRTLGVVHQLIGYSAAQEAQLLTQLAAYDALLVDPRTFLYPRTSDREREAVGETLRRCGFTDVHEYPKLGVVFCSKAAPAAATGAEQSDMNPRRQRPASPKEAVS
jgi:hypothetical protein